MRFLPAVLLTIILIGATNVPNAAAQRKNKKPVRKTSATKQQSAQNKLMANNFKILLEADQSPVENPFIFVARGQEQYAELKNLCQDLPAAQTIDFSQNSVVAVFAGQKQTPGYKVHFEKITNSVTDKITTSIKVELTAPAKGAMLAQVITAPVKIVLVPVEEDKGISLLPGTNWRAKMQTFRTSQSRFEVSGGFVGQSHKLNVSGSIDILQTGNLITAFFNIGTGNDQSQGIFETASGQIENNIIELPRVDPGNLVENPRPPLKASGTLSGKNLSLTFKSLPTNVADGFMGQGSLSGTLVK